MRTEPFTDVQTINGVIFPSELKFRSLLVTGPPGSGKTTLINNLKGWPEEGYINLSLKKWWVAPHLSLRPREIHLGFPFKGIKEDLAVFEPKWIEADPPLQLDFERIFLPPHKRHFWSVDWYDRYAFEFLLPKAKNILEWRTNRARYGSHHIDKNVSLDQIEQQLSIYRSVAEYLFEQGLYIYVREDVQGQPLRIII